MSRWAPSAAAAESLRFLVPGIAWSTRWWLTLGGFVLGLGLFVAGQPWGLAFALAGHLPLWVRRQTNSPGGATPSHEEIWVPTEDDWIERVDDLEEAGARWDASPWDITSGRGVLTLLAIAALGAILCLGLGALFGDDLFYRVAISAAVLFVPLWLNGMRTTWNPSELRLKGDALSVATVTAMRHGGEDFEQVPMLALREGARGKYPVDARLMLRPAGEDDSGFIGIQIQVALNNVQGTDYPYLYCVVLGREGFRLPASRPTHRPRGVGFRVVFERDSGEGAEFYVIRRHADQAGGWHTEHEHIEGLVRLALEHARAAWQANRDGGRTS